MDKKTDKIIKLPEPKYSGGGITLEEAIKERRSVRDYTNEPVTLEELSQLLWAAQGITGRSRGRSAPSAGATYPLELYAVAQKVSGIDPGVYRYSPRDHSLVCLMPGNYCPALSLASLGQLSVMNAPVSLVFAAVFDRTVSRYGERGVRYVHIDVGHAAENVYLQCAGLRMGTVAVGAFDDEKVKEALKLNMEESPVYIMPVGKI
ncbi:MAG: SagB/ThcOx family dehydrogenase [Candidatus Altiarchaeia archaeon]